jgi:hypothetical protein
MGGRFERTITLWSVGKAVFALAISGALAAAQSSSALPPAQSIVSAPPASSSATVATDSADATDTVLDPASLLPDLPELPRAKASLIGGTVDRLDRVRDQLTVQVFGGGKMKISFDPRTHVFDNGIVASLSALRRGDRVYVDTILDGSTVFARTIRVRTTGMTGESQGTVVSYRADKGELMLRDALSPEPLKIHVTPQTQLTQGGHAFSAGELTAGTLVAVKFGPQNGNGGRGDVAREINVLALPGASFTFAGRVTAVDLRLGILVIDSSTDHKTYEISFDPALATQADTLRPDTNVTVIAQFEGDRYVARTLTVNVGQSAAPNPD